VTDHIEPADYDKRVVFAIILVDLFCNQTDRIQRNVYRITDPLQLLDFVK
jgi:hypothetical protein